MGNEHSQAHGILLNVERPLVPDLQPGEEVVVELIINGQKIAIEQWPSELIAVPPPFGGVLRIRVYAKNLDKEGCESREIGHCIVPHEVCEIFHEPCFQVFLGLLDSSAMPSEGTPPSSVSRSLFESSMIAAKTPGTPKMNLLFATCEEGRFTEDAKMSPELESEDMWRFVRRLQDKPLMKLLSHSATIIQENFQSETRATRELMICQGEFAAKEKLYQEVMNAAIREKHEKEERGRAMRALAGETIFFNLMGRSADFGFRLWKHHVHHMQKQRQRHFQHVRFEKLSDNFVLHKTSSEAKSVIFHWYSAVQKAKQYRKQMKQAEKLLGHALDGEKRRLLAHSFFSWAHARETQRIQDLMNGKLGQAHEEAAMRMAEAERKHDAAKKSVDLVLRKWEAGAIEGLLSGVFTSWHKFTMKNVAYRSQHAAIEASLHKFLEGEFQAAMHTSFLYWHKYSAMKQKTRVGKASTHTALLKFLEGERMGNMHSCFQQWQAHLNYAKIHGWYDTKQNELTKKMDGLISDEKRRYGDLLEKEKTDKRAAFAYAMQSWATNDLEAAMWQTFRAWHQRAKHAAAHGRSRQSVHAALLQMLEGKERAAISLCFLNWASDAKHCRIQCQSDQEVKKWEIFVEELRINHKVDLTQLCSRQKSEFDYEVKKWEGFVEEQRTTHGKELTRLCHRQKMAKELAHEVMNLMSKKLTAAVTRGLLAGVFKDWKREVARSAELEQEHEAAKTSITMWLEEEQEELNKQMGKSKQRLLGLLANRSGAGASAGA